MSLTQRNGHFHLDTPALHSLKLSSKMKVPVYIKLENMQPSGSFKLRGIGNHCQQSVRKGCKSLIGSSGGNAGLAMAYSAQKLGVPITVFVPESTAPLMVERLKEYQAKVVVHGTSWNACNNLAIETSKKTPACSFIHPYDHPDVWSGNATMIEELYEQIGTKPSCIVAGVGGGGLLVGILQGMTKVGWGDVPVLAMETEGSECYNLSLKENRQVELPSITSIAKSFGALSVTQHLLDITPQYNITSQVIPDEDALTACKRFLDDHRMLVEPACGASLSTVYSGLILKLVESGSIPALKGPVVIIACGGAGVTMEQINEWTEVIKNKKHNVQK